MEIAGSIKEHSIIIWKFIFESFYVLFNSLIIFFSTFLLIWGNRCKKMIRAAQIGTILFIIIVLLTMQWGNCVLRIFLCIILISKFIILVCCIIVISNIILHRCRLPKPKTFKLLHLISYQVFSVSIFKLNNIELLRVSGTTDITIRETPLFSLFCTYCFTLLWTMLMMLSVIVL